MLIAVIYIQESIVKLLRIRETHNYSNNPFVYNSDFNENNTGCFRCIHHHVHGTLNASFDEMKPELIVNERVVIALNLKFQH